MNSTAFQLTKATKTLLPLTSLLVLCGTLPGQEGTASTTPPQQSATFTDRKTNLMWAKSDNGKELAWTEARSYCEAQALAGYKDWRLPAVKELGTIYVDQPVVLIQVGPRPSRIAGGILLTHAWVWSGSIRSDKVGEAAAYHFAAVKPGPYWRSANDRAVVLCVRDNLTSSRPVVPQTAPPAVDVPISSSSARVLDKDKTGPPSPELLRAGDATAPLPATSQIRSRALAALDENTAKYRDLLYDSQSWVEIQGASGRKPTPMLYAHTELIDSKLVEVMDKWADGPAFSKVYKDKRQLIVWGKGIYEPDEWARELLSNRRQLIVKGLLPDHSAYVVESHPANSNKAERVGLAQCASGVNGVLYIDAKSFFPLRIDANVVSPGRCEAQSYGVLGSQIHWQFTLVTGKDPCSEQPREIFAPKISSISGHRSGTSVTVGLGTPATRQFSFGSLFGSDVLLSSIKSRDHFRIYLTGACPHFPEDELTPFVETSISFDMKSTVDAVDERTVSGTTPDSPKKKVP
jgi:hypothetical protein